MGADLVNRIDKIGMVRRVVSWLDRVAQLRHLVAVKSACIPSVPVEPEFLAEIESVLADGESLAEFVEAAVRASVERR